VGIDRSIERWQHARHEPPASPSRHGDPSCALHYVGEIGRASRLAQIPIDVDDAATSLSIEFGFRAPRGALQEKEEGFH
jgi:hypothetical protein